MTHREAKSASEALRSLADLNTIDIMDWLAPLEDKLRESLPENSAILERFRAVKTGIASTPSEASAASEAVPKLQDELKPRVRELVHAACLILDSYPKPEPSPESLGDEIDRHIQQGYFKSIYFRTLVGGFAVLVALITGITSFKVNEQVQAMQKLVDDAKKEVADGKTEVDRAKAEVDKAKDESTRQQASLALLVLQGNSDLVKLRTNAMTEMAKEEDSFRAEIAERTRRWQTESEGSVSTAKQKIDGVADTARKEIEGKAATATGELNKAVSDNKDRLRVALTSAVSSLQAAQRPWVPRILWSMTKAWVLVPLGFFFAMMGFLIATSRSMNLKYGAALAITGSVAFLLLLSFWRSI